MITLKNAVYPIVAAVALMLVGVQPDTDATLPTPMTAIGVLGLATDASGLDSASPLAEPIAPTQS